ncbi:MAG: hypothetical protein C0596_10825 [Marinilabiliales bacterium]|nr:MAG: hypothetical protein C0596_10825 [Marinilabiliales bacterium]
MEITYESIKPLIIEETWNGNQVYLQFKANNQEQPLQTLGVAMPDQEEMMKQMKKEMAKSAGSSMAVSAGASALGRLTGIHGAGSAMSSAASQAGVGYQMDMDKMMNIELTEEVKQKTIVDAFKNLKMYFEYKDGEWSFVQPQM